MLLDAFCPGGELERGLCDCALSRCHRANHGRAGVPAERVLEDARQLGVAVGQMLSRGALAQLANDLCEEECSKVLYVLLMTSVSLTCPSTMSELLMFPASLSLWPLAPV